MCKEYILGYPVASLSATDCADRIIASVSNGVRRMRLGCFNPHSYVVALNDNNFSKALRECDLLVPDGVGVVLASRLLGGKIRSRVTGFDIFLAVNEIMNTKDGMTVFFLGSTDDVLGEICIRMKRDYPNIVVAGSFSPPFKSKYSDEELVDMERVINSVSPDVLWVGMTAPRQEKWIAEMVERLDVGFLGAVGAVFDFYSGRVRRSHSFFQRMGLEWLPRLLQEPGRLWKRMFVSAPIFVWHVLLARMGLCND